LDDADRVVGSCLFESIEGLLPCDPGGGPPRPRRLLYRSEALTGACASYRLDGDGNNVDDRAVEPWMGDSEIDPERRRPEVRGERGGIVEPLVIWEAVDSGPDTGSGSRALA
jgi:hypothetical protein